MFLIVILIFYIYSVVVNKFIFLAFSYLFLYKAIYFKFNL